MGTTTTSPVSLPAGSYGAPVPPPQIPTPANATDWAYILLALLNIDPTTHEQSIADLAAQINLEQGSNTVTNGNPLNLGPGTTYPNWLDAAEATVNTINANPAMLSALKSNASIGTYATALGNSNWEGGGAGAQVNKSYGLDVAARYNAMVNKTGGYSFANFSTDYASYITGLAGGGPGVLDDIEAALKSVPEGAAQTATDALDPSWIGELGTLLGDLDSASFWKRIGIFALGAVLALVGLGVFISTTKPGQEAESVGALAVAA